MVFNFDEWAQLYKTDPAEFERRRKAVIAEVIAKAPAAQQLKLQRLQWKLDAIHSTNTPVGALLKMQEMMWDSFLNMNDQLQAFAHVFTPPPATPKLKLIK